MAFRLLVLVLLGSVLISQSATRGHCHHDDHFHDPRPHFHLTWFGTEHDHDEDHDHDHDAVYVSVADYLPGSRSALEECSLPAAILPVATQTVVPCPARTLWSGWALPPPGPSCPLHVRHLVFLI